MSFVAYKCAYVHDDTVKKKKIKLSELKISRQQTFIKFEVVQFNKMLCFANEMSIINSLELFHLTVRQLISFPSAKSCFPLPFTSAG